MKYVSTLPCHMAVLLGITGLASPAAASWLHCAAAGTGTSGPFDYQTLAVDVGAVSPDRMTYLKSVLSAYVQKQDQAAHGVQVQCAVFDDSGPAASLFSRDFQVASRKYGWDHVTVVAPEAWLSSKDIVDQPAFP